MTKVMEKAENPLHIYSEYWMQGCGERCPYLNRKTLKKRNKRNIFYMKKKCGRISGYMFCFYRSRMKNKGMKKRRTVFRGTDARMRQCFRENKRKIRRG